MAENYLKQYEILYKKAVVDFNMAKVAFAEFEKGEIELDLEVIFFHLQQCAEKLIKAVLDFKEIRFTKTHDLALLIQLLDDNSIFIHDDIKQLIDLTDYAVEGRYAVLCEDISNAENYFKLLNEMIQSCKSCMK